MPSRVPLSTLSPAQYPLERKEIRLGRLELREEPRPILLDEASEELVGQRSRVRREQRPFHPFHYGLARRQDMRIDHQPHVRIGEPATIQNPCVALRRLHGMDPAPPVERRAKRL